MREAIGIGGLRILPLCDHLLRKFGEIAHTPRAYDHPQEAPLIPPRGPRKGYGQIVSEAANTILNSGSNARRT